MKIIKSIEAARSFIEDRNIANAGELSQNSVSSKYNDSVDEILQNVRMKGDQALIEYTNQFDRVDITKIQLNHEDISNGAKNISKELFDALKVSSKRIYEFAKRTMPSSWFDSVTGLGESVVPMQKVGLYVPGGTATYPSTVLMSSMIAKAVGVPEIILCTPPKINGMPDDSILAAAQIAGIDKVYCIGGAQAIAAMAYGTQTIPKVDKICGPGNIFVTLAKKKVFGEVGIDGLFGPTETVVIADEIARPEFCAADMLAQAEHDELAFPVLITTSENILNNVEIELNRQLENLDRNQIAKESINNNCALILVDNVEMCVELSNLIAPEHVCLNIQNPNDWMKQIINAGAIFVGDYSAEVMGDYIAGPSHTLPTFGTSRYSSYLGAQQFIKYMPIIGLDNETVKELIPTAMIISEHEGLTGHRESARIRL